MEGQQLPPPIYLTAATLSEQPGPDIFGCLNQAQAQLP